MIWIAMIVGGVMVLLAALGFVAAMFERHGLAEVVFHVLSFMCITFGVVFGILLVLFGVAGVAA